MKKKLYFLCALFWCMLVSFGQDLDQFNTPLPQSGGVAIYSAGKIAQSFTAGVTSGLSKINFYVDNNPTFYVPGNFTCRIYEGDGVTGTVLNTTNFTINEPSATLQTAEREITLSSLVPIKSGNKYTFELGGNGTNGSILIKTTLDSYFGGTAYFNGNQNSGVDLWFKAFTQDIMATHFNFDGANDQIRTINPSVFNSFNSNMTLEAWVRAETFKENVWEGNIINKETNGNGNDRGYMLRVGADGKVNFALGSIYGFSELTSPQNTVQLNTWHHIAATYDGQKMRLFVDGIQVNEIDRTGLIHVSYDDLIIGNWIGNDRGFDGDIDDVRIWDITRTPAQIFNFKNCQLNGNETGLIGYYKFNQGVDAGNNGGITSILDATSNGNNLWFGGSLNVALNGTSSNFLAGSVVNSDSSFPTAPTTTLNQSFCLGQLVATLVPESSLTRKWYSSETATTELAPTEVLATGTYYLAAVNTFGCESERTAVTVTNSTALPTTTASTVYYLINDVAIPLSASGTNLKWYTNATGGVSSTTAPTPITTTDGITSYWVSQTVAGCESDRLEIKVRVSGSATHLDFDGTDDAISINMNILSYGSDFTVEFWYKDKNETNNVSPKHIISTSSNIFEVKVIGSYLYVNTNNLNNIFVAKIDSNTWTHYSLVKNNTTLKVYANGVLVNTIKDLIFESSQPLTTIIGSDFTRAKSGKFELDELRFWTIARTASQVIGSFNCELNGTENGLVRYYKFNQGNNSGFNTTVRNALDAVSNTTNAILENFGLTDASSNWISGSPVTTGQTIPVVPPATNQIYCGETLASTLVPAISTTIKWYNSNSVALQETDFLVSGTYHVVAVNANGCESERTSVSVNNTTAAPSATATVYNYTLNQTPTQLDGTITGTNLMWYSSQFGGVGSTTTPIISTESYSTSSYWVSQNNGTCESDRLEIKVIVRPINDVCTGAISLKVGTLFQDFDVTVDVNGSTISEPEGECSQSNYDVWYSFVVPSTGNVTIEANGFSDNFEGGITVFEGNCSSLTEYNCNNSYYANSTFAKLELNELTPGETMYFKTWAWENYDTGFFDPYQISVYDSTPINDECNDAISLTVGKEFFDHDVTVDVSGANYSSSNVDCSTSEYDVWYSFLVPTTGSITIQATGFSGDYEGGVALFDGNCNELGEIDCNNNYYNDDNTTAKLKVANLPPGATMYVKTWAWENYDIGGFSPYQISVYDNPPVNDNCSGAIALTPGSDVNAHLVDVYVSNAYPSDKSNENDVWYSVEIPESGSITVETSGTTFFDTYLQIYDDCNETTLIDSNNDIDNLNGNTFSKVVLSDLTPASIIYIKVFENVPNTDRLQNATFDRLQDIAPAQFQISAYDASILSNTSFTKESFDVYPNPSKGIFNFSLQNDSVLEVIDMLGKVIYTSKVKAGNNTIDISNYQSGMYLLKVKTESGSFTKKLIKE